MKNLVSDLLDCQYYLSKVECKKYREIWNTINKEIEGKAIIRTLNPFTLWNIFGCFPPAISYYIPFFKRMETYLQTVNSFMTFPTIQSSSAFFSDFTGKATNRHLWLEYGLHTQFKFSNKLAIIKKMKSKYSPEITQGKSLF